MPFLVFERRCLSYLIQKTISVALQVSYCTVFKAVIWSVHSWGFACCGNPLRLSWWSLCLLTALHLVTDAPVECCCCTVVVIVIVRPSVSHCMSTLWSILWSLISAEFVSVFLFHNNIPIYQYIMLCCVTFFSLMIVCLLLLPLPHWHYVTHRTSFMPFTFS